MARKDIFDLIAAERQKQVMVEGYFPSHDDQFVNGELALAASVYAHPEKNRNMVDWPFGEKRYHPSSMCRKSELIKACSLLIAGIERLERAGIH